MPLLRLIHHGCQRWTTLFPPPTSINHNRLPQDRLQTLMALSTYLHLQVSQPLHHPRSNQHPPIPPPTFPTPLHPASLPPPTSNLTSAGSTSTLSPLLQSQLRRIQNLLKISLPLLAAPRATSVPRPHHVPPPLPARGKRIHVLDPQFPPPQHHVQHHNNSFPPCNLFQNIPRQPSYPPTRLRPSTNLCNQCLQLRDDPSSRERRPTRHRLQHHPKPRPRKYTHGHPTILFNHHNSHQLHLLQNTPRHLQPPHRLPQSCAPCHLGTTTRRGAPCRSIFKTMNRSMTPGTPTTTDRGAAFSRPQDPSALRIQV